MYGQSDGGCSYPSNGTTTMFVGGPWVNAVYQIPTAPVYMGCWRDDPSGARRALRYQGTNVSTVEACLNQAVDSENPQHLYEYVGIQNWSSLKGTGECWYDDYPGTYGTLTVPGKQGYMMYGDYGMVTTSGASSGTITKQCLTTSSGLRVGGANINAVYKRTDT
jgi:hypothetical protein